MLQKKDVKIELYKVKKIIENNRKKVSLNIKKNKKYSVEDEKINKNNENNIVIIKNILVNQLKCILNQIDELQDFQEELEASIKNKSSLVSEIIREKKLKDKNVECDRKGKNKEIINESIKLEKDERESGRKPNILIDKDLVKKENSYFSSKLNKKRSNSRGRVKSKEDTKINKIKKEKNEDINIRIKTDNISKKDNMYLKLEIDEEEITRKPNKKMKEKQKEEEEEEKKLIKRSDNEIQELEQYINDKKKFLDNMKATYDMLHKNENFGKYNDFEKRNEPREKGSNNMKDEKGKIKRINIIDNHEENKQHHQRKSSFLELERSKSPLSIIYDDKEKKIDYRYKMQKTYEEIQRLQHQKELNSINYKEIKLEKNEKEDGEEKLKFHPRKFSNKEYYYDDSNINNVKFDTNIENTKNKEYINFRDESDNESSYNSIGRSNHMLRQPINQSLNQTKNGMYKNLI